MKPGRNDPCPCGSGKKYKHCCLDPMQGFASSPAELMWRRLRALLEGHPDRMMRFVKEAYGEQAVFEAWSEFIGSDAIEMEAGLPLMPLFMPWCFHCWSPDPVETQVRDKSLHDVIPTAAYLAAKGRRLDPLLRRYLESLLAAPLTFYEVLANDPGRQLTLRDVMTREEREVIEHSASKNVQRGDLLFAQLATVDDLNMLEASSGYLFPPIEKAHIIELRAAIAAGNPVITHQVLRDHDFELIEVFHEISARLLNPQLPQMQNTDGEPLSLRKLVFDLKVPPVEAFDALKHLAHFEKEEEMLADAVRDASGALKKVSFSWHNPGNALHPDWENTRMGVIEINGKRLTAEVNSEARGETVRSHIETALGAGVQYRTCQVQSVKRMLKDAQALREAGTSEAQRESERLAELPEVREQMARMMEAHWERWTDQPIPLLGDKTPREAIKDEDGREVVESLILEAERGSRNMKPPTDEAVFRRLRERLGLQSV